MSLGGVLYVVYTIVLRFCLRICLLSAYFSLYFVCYRLAMHRAVSGEGLYFSFRVTVYSTFRKVVNGVQGFFRIFVGYRQGFS